MIAAESIDCLHIEDSLYEVLIWWLWSHLQDQPLRLQSLFCYQLGWVQFKFFLEQRILIDTKFDSDSVLVFPGIKHILQM